MMQFEFSVISLLFAFCVALYLGGRRWTNPRLPVNKFNFADRTLAAHAAYLVSDQLVAIGYDFLPDGIKATMFLICYLAYFYEPLCAMVAIVVSGIVVAVAVVKAAERHLILQGSLLFTGAVCAVLQISMWPTGVP